MGITIKDIAIKANVSRGTVDRVINNRGNVSLDVKERILKIAKEMGYEKNIMASHLAKGKFHTIAIVLPKPESDPFWELPMQGIERAGSLVKNYGVEAVYYNFNLFDKDEFCQQFSLALESGAEAILTAPVFTLESIEFLDKAKDIGIPVITINTELEHHDILCYVGQDSFQSGILAGRLFDMSLKEKDEVAVLNLGHNVNNAAHYSDKYRGLSEYYNSKGKDTSKVHFYECQQFNDKSALETFFDEIKENHPNLGGLFFTNSRAYKLIDVIDENKINDLVLIGYDMITQNKNYLRNGRINFIIHQNSSEQGYMGIMNYVNHFILKKEIESKQYLPLDIVIKENVDFYDK